MEVEVLELVASQGAWAVLTVGLILYVLKNQEKRDIRQEEREQKYQEIISNLTDKLNLIEDIRTDVQEVKSYFLKNK